ncbi:zinc-binding dehydrogenase [Veronia pacifica]|nr:zinc-binding dehydrogenase [Veronia pacifica]
MIQIALLGHLIGKVTGKRLSVIMLQPNQGLEHINKMFESGTLKTHIDGPFSFEDIPREMARFGRGEHIGKIVINVV